MKTIVLPETLWIRASLGLHGLAVTGSSAPKGSSISNMAGSPASARATPFVFDFLGREEIGLRLLGVETVADRVRLGAPAAVNPGRRSRSTRACGMRCRPSSPAAPKRRRQPTVQAWLGASIGRYREALVKPGDASGATQLAGRPAAVVRRLARCARFSACRCCPSLIRAVLPGLDRPI